jgi:hypothetical protein
MAQLTTLGALKRFFADDPRPLTVQELKALSADERTDLGTRAAHEMGMEIGQEVAD